MNGDLPISDKTVKLKHHVRKFFCESTNYIRKIFNERCKHHLNSYGRRFERLNKQLSSMGLELGGNVVSYIKRLFLIIHNLIKVKEIS